VLSIITDAWEGLEHNGWGVLPIIEMLKEVEIQWMGSAPYCLYPCQPKKLFYRWGVLPIVARSLTRFQHLASFSSYLLPHGSKLIENSAFN
jgi:hypothetical protein